jgi:hypothetical protein
MNLGLHPLQMSIYGVVVGRATSFVLRMCPTAGRMCVKNLEFLRYRLPFCNYDYFRFTVATTCFWCSCTSRNVSRTAIGSGDLEKVCVVFGIFQLSFAVLELLLLPGFWRLLSTSVFQYVARRRAFLYCFGRPGNCRLSSCIFSHKVCRSGYNTISGWRRPCWISLYHVGLLTLPIQPGNKVLKHIISCWNPSDNVKYIQKYNSGKTPNHAHVSY